MASSVDDDMPPELDDLAPALAAERAAAATLLSSSGPPASATAGSGGPPRRVHDASTLAGESLGGPTVGKSLAEAALPSYVRAGSNAGAGAAAPSPPASAAASDDGTETLQAQMMAAALAAQPAVAREKKEKEQGVTKEFMKGTTVKKGFLLGGGGGGKSKSSSSPSPSSSSPRAAAAAPSPPSDPLVHLRPQAGANPLHFDEVQESMRNTVKDTKSWMTPELLERVVKEPRLALGMQNPRFVAALGEMGKNPQAAMEKYKHDAGLQDFLRTFMGVMGEHFSTLGGEQRERGEAQDAAGAGKTKKAAERGSAAASELGLVPSSTRRLAGAGAGGAGAGAGAGAGKGQGASPAGPGPWPAQGILAPDSDVSSEDIAAAAKEGRLPNADDEVRAALSNKHLVDVLRDPIMQRIMEECRVDGRKLAFYMKDPDIRRKFLVLQKAGLIRIET
jgi:hypothetical protein